MLKPGQKSWSENTARMFEQRDRNTTMRVACAFCDWTAEGSTKETRELQHQHRLQHVTPKPGKRKRLGQWNINHAALHDNIAKARGEGAAGWASE